LEKEKGVGELVNLLARGKEGRKKRKKGRTARPHPSPGGGREKRERRREKKGGELFLRVFRKKKKKRGKKKETTSSNQIVFQDGEEGKQNIPRRTSHSPPARRKGKNSPHFFSP